MFVKLAHKVSLSSSSVQLLCQVLCYFLSFGSFLWAVGVHFGQLLVPLGALWGHFWRWCGAARQPGARGIQGDQRGSRFCMIFTTC